MSVYLVAFFFKETLLAENPLGKPDDVLANLHLRLRKPDLLAAIHLHQERLLCLADHDGILGVILDPFFIAHAVSSITICHYLPFVSALCGTTHRRLRFLGDILGKMDDSTVLSQLAVDDTLGIPADLVDIQP
jgi:hypothetical protein